MNNQSLFISIFLLIVLKFLAINLTTFNLFGDEAQYWLWSKEIDFGYFSKPPFLAWSIRLYTEIFGDSFISLKLLPSLVYLLISWALYNLLQNSGLDKKNSFAGSIIFLFIPAVSFSSFFISTDLFLLLFWTLSLNELIKIKKEENFRNFILLGIFLGLGFLSKYAAIYFIICMFILILLDIKFRQVVRRNYLRFISSLMCMSVIIIPNIIWNINNEWVTLSHTADNANFANVDINFLRGLEFFVIQICMLGPLLVFGGVISFSKINNIQKTLLIFSLPIILIVFIEAIIVRANANWAAPALVSLFVYLYIRIYNSLIKILNVIVNFTFCVVFFIMIATSHPSALFNRISGLNDFAYKIYGDASNGFEKNMVISDRLLFSSISYELRNKNVSFYMPHEMNEKITNHFKLTSPLDKKMNMDFTFIGHPSDISYLENNYRINKKNSPPQKFMKRDLNVYEVIFD